MITKELLDLVTLRTCTDKAAIVQSKSQWISMLCALSLWMYLATQCGVSTLRFSHLTTKFKDHNMEVVTEREEKVVSIKGALLAQTDKG